MIQILEGDCRDVLRTLSAESVHCCVTSPPYFGLRDYGIAEQMGLEATPDEYIAGMVEVFREVRRVLRDDGTLFLNIGDSYSGSGKGVWNVPDERKALVKETYRPSTNPMKTVTGLKPKDLIGIPWMLAFALRADGWYLRQDIIWAKPNPTPESVRDRCTKAHEYLFLLSKAPRYYFDADAIQEPFCDERMGASGTRSLRYSEQSERNGDSGLGGVPTSYRGSTFTQGKTGAVKPNVGQGERIEATGRNKRSVWTIATAPFKEAHFATFPPALVEPCILAGCPVGGTVLDPFGGAGTTGLVADRLQRDAILIELNPAYAEIARKRVDKDLLNRLGL